MKKTLLLFMSLLTSTTILAASKMVTVVYNGTTATVTIPNDLTGYVTCSSGSSSHVKLVQSDDVSESTTDEIIYSLSGSSTDGEFYMEGSFKATIQLGGLTLTNPKGPALNIQDGKRIKVSIKNSTTNTLTDGTNEDYNGCIHCKGHTEFAGKGTLNVTGNSKHAIYSKEYVEIKNCTINITGAQKDGIHCKEYFLMESGTVTISKAGDDGIQVELDGTTSTGIKTDHEDEDTGNFYMEDGKLTISGCTAYAIKADGIIKNTGGTRNITGDILENATSGISSILTETSGPTVIYDLHGRQMPNSATLPKGIYLIREGKKTKKVIVRSYHP